MRKIYVLIFFLLFALDKSFSAEEVQGCEVRNLDINALQDGSEADEIIEVWCREAFSDKLSLVTQCFTYYKYSSSGEVMEPKVKCNYY